MSQHRSAFAPSDVLQTAPPPEPQLICVCGNAGVGKTTFAKQLARAWGAFLLDIDTVSERLVQAGQAAAGRDPNDRDSPLYKRTFRDAIHETLFAIATENLPHRTCIVVAPFTRERRDPNFLATCKGRFDVPVRVFYLTCSEEVRRTRIIERANPRDRIKLDDWERYSAEGRDSGPPPFSHLLVCTDPPGPS